MDQDELQLEAELEKIRPLYQEVSSQSVSQEVDERILNLARNKTRRRVWSIFSIFRAPITRGQISTFATVAALAVISAWFVSELQPGVNHSGDVVMSKSLAAAINKIDQDELSEQIEKALTTVSELRTAAVASNKWNTQVDELMKIEVPAITKYSELANKLEAAGDTEEAQEIRELTGKLQKIFKQRDPDWRNIDKND